MDIFSFSTEPGATVTISLTNLPDDYDILLLSDPRETIPLSDSIDLENVADLGQHAIGQHAIGQLCHQPAGARATYAIGQHAIGFSSQNGTNPELLRQFCRAAASIL